MSSAEHLKGPHTTPQTRQAAYDRNVGQPEKPIPAHGQWNAVVTTGLNTAIRDTGSIESALRAYWVVKPKG